VNGSCPDIPGTPRLCRRVAYAAQYDDITIPVAGAIGQSQAVYLHGCGLPLAWAGRSSYVVLETGFGSGLNFLTTWAAWRADPARPHRLHFLSVELHPFIAADLATLHASWPELAVFAAELRAHWPVLTPGFHRIVLDQGRVLLTLMLGDALPCLKQLDAMVDAIYLDGFAPDRNPDMWQARVYRELARLARPGARLATYSVAGSVRQGLTAVGFVCQKCAGYGHKRQRLEARFDDPYGHKTRGRACQRVVALPSHVAVIGAGVAGCALAHALAKRGVRVSVLDAVGVAAGASGNPVAVFRPLPSKDDNRMSRLTRAAFLYSLDRWQALGAAVRWSRFGVLQCARDTAYLQKLHAVLLANAAPHEFARWIDAAEAAQRTNGLVSEPAVWYPNAGWIDPASLCRAWLDDPLIEFVPSQRVARLQALPHGWQARAVADQVLIEADALVVANAFDAARLLVLPGLQGIRGQINVLPGAALPKLDCVIAREGYVSPGAHGDYVVGASYEFDADPNAALTPSTRGDLDNRQRLAAILPGFEPGAMIGRVSVRAVMPDRFPLLGSIQPGLYVAAGYASRGVVWSALLGETLACMMSGEPLPIERDIVRAMNPLR
jgi:tRNA U-34 5-methylaminomethyl-2-thiouridine biosynthesis protein MnmC, C-terminal domain